jgi:hypothetical protein
MVTGDFICYYNALTSLDGCPTKVGGDFYCSYNQLETLQHCVKEVGGHFTCGGNDLIIIVSSILDTLSRKEMQLFLRYQNYYEVWSPSLNVCNMNELISDLKNNLNV